MIDDQIGEALGQVEAGLLKGIKRNTFHFQYFFCNHHQFFIFIFYPKLFYFFC